MVKYTDFNIKKMRIFSPWLSVGKNRATPTLCNSHTQETEKVEIFQGASDKMDGRPDRYRGRNLEISRRRENLTAISSAQQASEQRGRDVMRPTKKPSLREQRAEQWCDSIRPRAANRRRRALSQQWRNGAGGRGGRRWASTVYGLVHINQAGFVVRPI